jgi:hypothetical protein
MARVALALVPACWLISGYAQAQPEAPEPAPLAPESAPPPDAPATAPPGKAPPSYYVEPREPAEQRPPVQQGVPPRVGVYEPPPPGYYPTIYEPPPPPKPRHVAPKYSFWVGARLGWFVPFGDLWAQSVPGSGGRSFEGVGFSEYASSGPMFEVDVGARLGRHYNVFLAWERAMLGTGSAEPDAHGGQETGDTDFYAIGLRVSSDANRVGFLTEINLGYRRFRARWSDGTELHLTDAPLEFRLGLGADIRLGPAFSLSPMVTLGVGAFGAAEWQHPNGDTEDATLPGDRSAGHGWLTLQIGGHFDLAGGG